MSKRHSWSVRIGTTVLSALLVFSFIPLAACSSSETTEAEGSGSAASDPELLESAPRSASEDLGGSAQAATVDYDTSTYVSPEEKWEPVDDGSAVLDVVEPYVNENAASQTLTVKAEGGSLRGHRVGRCRNRHRRNGAMARRLRFSFVRYGDFDRPRASRVGF